MARSTRYLARYDDPDGTRYGLPTSPWGCARPGLATRRQLRALGLCPGGRAPVAQVMWRRRRRGQPVEAVAFLYDLEQARPKRVASPAVLAAVDRALEARRTCSTSGRVQPYVIPARFGECIDCAEPATSSPAAA